MPWLTTLGLGLLLASTWVQSIELLLVSVAFLIAICISVVSTSRKVKLPRPGLLRMRTLKRS